MELRIQEAETEARRAAAYAQIKAEEARRKAGYARLTADVARRAMEATRRELGEEVGAPYSPLKQVGRGPLPFDGLPLAAAYVLGSLTPTSTQSP